MTGLSQTNVFGSEWKGLTKVFFVFVCLFVIVIIDSVHVFAMYLNILCLLPCKNESYLCNDRCWSDSLAVRNWVRTRQ